VGRVDVELAVLAARQHGIVSVAQLQALGLGQRGAQLRAANGRLHRIYRGVYAVGHAALTPNGRRLAAVLACGQGAVLSHRSAAAAWGLRPASGARFDITTPRPRKTAPPGVDLHLARKLDPDDVGELDRIPITSMARTLVDLAGVVPAAALERAVHQAEVLRLLDVAAVESALARARNRRGTRRLRAVLAEPSPGSTRSALEERFLALCRGSRLPLPRLNHHLAIPRGLIEVDAYWPAAGLVVELDGAAAHRTARAFHADRRRDAALAAEGYLVIRLTWERVTREPAGVVDELRRVLARRSRQQVNLCERPDRKG
jgi:very-short-patch-repair endonuclease